MVKCGLVLIIGIVLMVVLVGFGIGQKADSVKTDMVTRQSWTDFEK
jgi:hypothetical protein